MDQHGKTVSELLRILGSHCILLAHCHQFRISSLHAPILCHYGGIADDACLQAEPVEMVLLHDCGHAMDVGNLCQVHRTYHAKPHIQSGRKARTLCRAESGEHHGASGLTAILFFVAVAFLTYLTTETITVIRKALNPIGYISNKVKFEITNHGKNRKDTEAIDEVYASAAYGAGTEDEKEEYKEEEPAKVIDLNLDPDQTFATPDTPSTSVEPEADGQEATGTEGDTDKDETIAIANGTQNENMSLIARQRELRTKRAEQEALEKQAAEAAAASEHIGMDISVATADEKATGNTLSNAEVLNNLINPKEPFTRYKYPVLNLLKKYEDDGVSIDEEEQRANKTASSRCWATLAYRSKPSVLRLVLPSHSTKSSLQKAYVSLRSRIWKMTSP